MRRAFAAAGFLGLAALCALAPASGAMSRRPPEVGSATVTGTVRVVGNEPFPATVLTVEPSSPEGRPRDYLLAGPLEKTLRKEYQGKVVTLEGTDCQPDRPGFSRCFAPAKIKSQE